MKYIKYIAAVIQFRRCLADETGDCDREELFFMTAEMLYTLLENWYGPNPALPLWQNAQSFYHRDVIVIHSHDDEGLCLRLGINKEGLYLKIKIGKGRPGAQQFSVLWPHDSYSLEDISREGKIIFESLAALSGRMVAVSRKREIVNAAYRNRQMEIICHKR